MEYDNSGLTQGLTDDVSHITNNFRNYLFSIVMLDYIYKFYQYLMNTYLTYII